MRVERRARVVLFAVACGVFFVKVDGGEQRAQLCFIAGGFVRADGDGGGVCDVFLQVVVVEERRDVIADAGWQLRREHPPKVGGGQAGKGGNARQEGGEGDVAGGIWHGFSLGGNGIRILAKGICYASLTILYHLAAFRAIYIQLSARGVCIAIPFVWRTNGARCK